MLLRNFLHNKIGKVGDQTIYDLFMPNFVVEKLMLIPATNFATQ